MTLTFCDRFDAGRRLAILLAHYAATTLTPRPFLAVGQWYNDFSQFTDEEVRKLLLRAA